MGLRSETAVGELLHKRGWRKAFTIAEMAAKWAWLTAEVERGYHDAVDEYTNDLCCRDWLHEAWPLLDDLTVLRWTARIQKLDTRFRAATTHDDGCALSHSHHLPPPALWWWRRHPRLLVGDLATALDATIR